ncbi:hypothetical protein CYMTET_50317 [Cymbomonas tetramitiformis]|uniref:Uncharacterized protein n=1 Tax=Cymbomonas tetramitiformis TaxID=36881 RepID=A0AAE0BQB4_9CHLO|nr:hypothetical protein CYMTET_50317 [Cymbomonas tetramitiformis]
MKINLRCVVNPSADYVMVHEDAIPKTEIRAASEEILKGEVHQEFQDGFGKCPMAIRHLSPPCRTLDARSDVGKVLYQVSHFGGTTVTGKRQKQGAALALAFKSFEGAPAQRAVLERVRDHARRFGVAPPTSCEPLIYCGLPTEEECRGGALEYGGRLYSDGLKYRWMSYSRPVGGKQNFHADGNGQDADTLLAVLGSEASDEDGRVPSAVFMLADARKPPFSGEFLLVPCIPGTALHPLSSGLPWVHITMNWSGLSVSLSGTC